MKINGEISGSLTQLEDGTSYLIAGENVTIVSQSNGSVLISAATGSGGGGGCECDLTVEDVFGTGVDGTALLDGTNTFSWASKSGSDYTMTKDVHLENLTINSSVTLDASGYRIFVSDDCVISGNLHNNGGDGSNSGGSPGPGGVGGGAGSFLGGKKGGGNDGDSESQTLGVFGVFATGGAGLSGGDDGGSYDGAWQVYALGDDYIPETVKGIILTATGSSFNLGGGAGGGKGNQGSGGGGGGVVALIAKNVTITSSGKIEAIGGDNDPNNWGGGGGGGLVILVKSTLTNNGSIDVSGGDGQGDGGDGAALTFTVV